MSKNRDGVKEILVVDDNSSRVSKLLDILNVQDKKNAMRISRVKNSSSSMGHENADAVFFNLDSEGFRGLNFLVSAGFNPKNLIVVSSNGAKERVEKKKMKFLHFPFNEKEVEKVLSVSAH